MQIEDLKTWHWVLAGLLAGVLFSCVRMWQGPAFVNDDVDTIAVGEFENKAYAGTKLGWITGAEGRYINEYHKGLPLLKDVVIHPPLNGDPEKKYWITGRYYWIGSRLVDPTKPGSAQKLMWGWKGFKYAAPTPYLPGYALRKQQLEEQLQSRQSRLANDSGIRLRAEIFNIKSEIQQADNLQKTAGGQGSFVKVTDYLKAVKGMEGSTLTYSFAWYELPAAVWTLPPLAGLLMIGIAWPLALSLMQNWGMARKPALAKKPKPAKPSPTPAMPIPSTAGVVFKPVVAAAAPVPVETEHAEYRGEFYPVVKATHKE